MTLTKTFACKSEILSEKLNVLLSPSPLVPLGAFKDEGSFLVLLPVNGPPLARNRYLECKFLFLQRD